MQNTKPSTKPKRAAPVPLSFPSKEVCRLTALPSKLRALQPIVFVRIFSSSSGKKFAFVFSFSCFYYLGYSHVLVAAPFTKNPFLNLSEAKTKIRKQMADLSTKNKKRRKLKSVEENQKPPAKRHRISLSDNESTKVEPDQKLEESGPWKNLKLVLSIQNKEIDLQKLVSFSSN